MKRLIVVFLLTMVLSGCGVFERGNYDKDRSGYVMSGDLLVSYHTNSIGEIDVFLIDEIMSYFEALTYASFDSAELSSDDTISSYVSAEELSDCGIETDLDIPKFIRIEYQTYYFNIRSNGYCTFDEYTFHKDGYSELTIINVEETSPIEDLNITIFKSADFKVNTFNTMIFIEDISYNSSSDEWEKEIVTALPMSIRQAGNMYEDNSSYLEEINSLERYVLKNQSINLLELREDYENDEVNNIWSEDTIDYLGRDHDVIRTVRTKKAGDILDIINDTLSRLGMFS